MVEENYNLNLHGEAFVFFCTSEHWCHCHPCLIQSHNAEAVHKAEVN